jgi:hypothetical protein
MEKSTQTEMTLTELTKDIYTKLDTIQSVLGYILEKTNLIPEPIKFSISDKARTPPVEKTVRPPVIESDDDLDARDAEGSVLP